MRLLVRKEEGKFRGRYDSWDHYKSTGYAYPDPPEVHDKLLFNQEELEKEFKVDLVEIPCGGCWGAREIYTLLRTPDGDCYVSNTCGTCGGLGYKIVIES